MQRSKHSKKSDAAFSAGFDASLLHSFQCARVKGTKPFLLKWTKQPTVSAVINLRRCWAGDQNIKETPRDMFGICFPSSVLHELEAATSWSCKNCAVRLGRPPKICLLYHSCTPKDSQPTWILSISGSPAWTSTTMKPCQANTLLCLFEDSALQEQASTNPSRRVQRELWCSTRPQRSKRKFAKRYLTLLLDTLHPCICLVEHSCATFL